MEKEMWSNILIDWVNCLKLDTNINSIDDLRNGDFFSNLQKVITKARSTQNDPLTFIFDLLGKHYPRYSFEDMSEIHLSDLTSNDLKAITSLLMHYTCMYDRKDVLTSPLCHLLTQATQIIIRDFLQKTTKDVTNKTLNGIIESCIESASHHQTNHQWLTVEASMKNSPLQDILKTPVSKFGRLQEKDRLIAKLKSELESERYDKADLQEELKLAVDKNRKIEQQLLQKNTEILRLKAEIEVYENSTPPQCQDMDSRELQRRLRSEIESLEKYIKQLENEQEEVRKEKDIAKENLRKLETQSTIWEEKFFETERNFENLKERSKKQEEELKQLRDHSNELSALLEEYKTKPSNDSSLFDGFTSVGDGQNLSEIPIVEDLACSVVEVQLRDAQKLNEELKSQIEKNEDVVTRLKLVLNENETKLKKSEDLNQELKTQITKLELEKGSLTKQLSETEHFFLQSKNEIIELRQKLNESNECYQDVVQQKKQMEEQLIEALASFTSEKEHSKVLEFELSKAETLSQKLQFELGDAVSENHKANTELDAMKHQIECLVGKQKEIESTRIILEKHLYQSQTYCENLKMHLDGLLMEKKGLCDEINANRMIMEKLKMENSDLSSHVREANDNIDCLERSNETLQRELNEAQKNNERLVEELEETKSILESLKKENESFKSSFELVKKERGEIASRLAEVSVCLENSNKKVENLKENQTQLEIELSASQAFSEALRTELEELKDENNEIKKELDESRNFVLVLENEKKSCAKEIVDLKNELTDTSETLHHARLKTETIERQLDDNQKKLETLNQKMNKSLQESEELRLHLKTTRLELNKVLEERNQLQGKLNLLDISKTKLEKECNTTKDILLKVEKDFESSEASRNKLKEELDQARDVVLKLEDDKNINVQTIATLEKELIETSHALNVAKNDLEQTKKRLKTLNKEMQDVQFNLKKVQEEKHQLICCNENQEKQLSLLAKLKAKLESSHTEKDKISEELDKVRQVVLKFTSDNDSLRNELQTARLELRKTQEEKDHLENEITVIREETNKFESELTDAQTELGKIRKERDEFYAKNTQLEQKTKMIEKKLQLSETARKTNEGFLRTLEIRLAEEKRICKETITQIQEKANENLINAKNEIQVLRFKKTEYEEKCANLEERVCEVVNNLLVSSKEVENLKKIKFDIEQDFGALKIDYDCLEVVKKNLEEEARSVSSKARALEENVKELETSNKVLVSLNEEIEMQTKKNLADITKEKEQVEKRFESLASEFTTLKANYKEVSELSESLKIEAEDLRVQYQKSKVELEKATEEKVKLSQRLKELEQTEELLRNHEEEISELKDEVHVLEKRLEIDQLVSSGSREKMKSLEETIQDYEITISGLKKVVDSNLENLEILKEELSENKRVQDEIVEIISQKLGSNNDSGEFKTYVCDTFANLIKSKEEMQRDIEGVKKLRELLEIDKNSKELGMIYNKICEIIQSKLKLEEDLEKMKKKIENPPKTQKENILGVSTKGNKSREDELKKENMMLKRKLVLAENHRTNLEKVLKELREEKKKAKESPSSSPSNDTLYKKLLQEYVQVKEEHEKILKEKDERIEQLLNNDDKTSLKELQSVRDAYANVVGVNSKLEVEIVNLRKKIEERNTEVANMGHIKEAYERLLEENNKVMTEIDTVKYKRSRDKEEFVRLLKEERDKNNVRETKRIQEIKNEYEGKLEKMKEKMLKLYREEVNKKVRSVKDGHSEMANLIKTVANLRSELFEADQKIQMLEMEKEMLKSNKRLDNLQLQTMSNVTSITKTEERKAMTLPRSSIAEEVTCSSHRTSLSGIPMQTEDEEDLFNDKYLTDLKEGRCNLQSDGDPNSRFSELAWRNSMVPPHLKSSYPAELQFVSPTRFKEEDIKTGNVEFEDSLCRLLPGEKPRKKDFGTTSYKRPGPPTPSKNGGRLSMQGNEVHPMKTEHGETKTPKKSTPSRIRALFTGRNSSTREESQTNVTPSRGRRLNIFRRPK